MEFERAVFRVYERCMEGLRDEVVEEGVDSRPLKSCLFLEVLCLMVAGFLFIALITLHVSFVQNPGCLLHALQVQTNSSYLKADQILYINVERKFETNKNLRSYDDDNYGRTSRKTKGLFQQQQQPSSVSFTEGSRYLKEGSKGSHISSNHSEDSYKERLYDFKYSSESSLLFLPYEMVAVHKFHTINVTLAGESCFGGSFLQGILPLGGVDTVILNFLMYSFKDSDQEEGSVLTGRPDQSFYKWSSSSLHPYKSVGEWLSFKIEILLLSLVCFFLLSTITALLVRVLISSGVVLLFPIFWLLQLFGFAGINLRIVSLSYPWIGVPLELLRARNQSATPFIIAHLSKVFVYYFLYQATQVVFAQYFYNQYQPGQAYLWIFVIMMLWEYYSMIYVRSSASIQLFPRASLGLFLVYHFYYFSFPSGFHVLAVVVLFFSLLFLMIHCIRMFEIKAFDRGLISLDQPRMIYNALPWPAWRASLAPDYTLMMPINMRSESAYHTNIPNRPHTGTPSDTPVTAANGSPPVPTDSSGTSNVARGVPRMTAFPTTNVSSGGSNYESADNDDAVDNDEELALSDDALLPPDTCNESSSVGNLMQKGRGSATGVSYSRLNTNDGDSVDSKGKRIQHQDSGGSILNPMVVKEGSDR